MLRLTKCSGSLDKKRRCSIPLTYKVFIHTGNVHTYILTFWIWVLKYACSCKLVSCFILKSKVDLRNLKIRKEIRLTLLLAGKWSSITTTVYIIPLSLWIPSYLNTIFSIPVIWFTRVPVDIIKSLPIASINEPIIFQNVSLAVFVIYTNVLTFFQGLCHLSQSKIFLILVP